MKNIALFASGSGSNFQAIIDAVKVKKLNVNVKLLVCDKPNAFVIERAKLAGIPYFSFRAKDFNNKAEYEMAILQQLKAHHVEFIVLAGYMRLIGSTLLQEFEGKIVNIHPSLLPAFPGKDAIGQALAAGVKVSGVTIHYVDEGMDTGPIISQETVKIDDDETKESLQTKIHQIEHQLYPVVLQKILGGKAMGKKRALISVSDKTGVAEFAKQLSELGFEIISTGGTSKALIESGVPVIGISEVTGFPEILEGRVKTLHPMIHGGLLAKFAEQTHKEQLEKHQIEKIDLVCVNLYPFQQTIAKEGVTTEEAIENIDIGGPTMLRAAAKNNEYVTVVVDPSDYQTVIDELTANGETTKETRRKLAAKVFRHTAAYDALIAEYMTHLAGDETPEKMTVTYELKQSLRYGENPHQKAAFYQKPLGSQFSIANATQLHGKELSYNNINDANAALQIVKEFTEPAAVAVKHMNPCGVGIGTTIYDAYSKAYEADPISIFGGIIALNREVDQKTAEKLHEIFLEIIIAPSFSEEAIAILTGKKNIRLLTVPFEQAEKKETLLTSVEGGLLVQEADVFNLDNAEIVIPTKRKPTEEEWKSLKLGWKVVKHVKSNAIVVAKDDVTIGIGAGQMNRVGAAKIALEQAGDRATGAALASDAFFPMDDTVEAAAKSGIAVIIQPGGSIRDQDSIKKADEYGIAMVFTGIRHFKH
ncbi:bifunctional phosphoribosylaminoimidazolecarboxamide formyltransferase/IMP cyclohydrolase [Bacillus aquiflavi]|uniref:Bifunctional purine biosynthesis protein PurH n=2 Tax=Bacillus aquiflavi TaxID=2672567 RepID=A0A6B3W239_9BACI|nr:bifunctional phosphoribosylaminoimidazolecarboxamide formyltransferase/IMP cyclohydrolase [Bacillus aquiflavi]NEY82557.1 bifunctional phosphoribosylaminoimidazolecarboxamide formyltransferase/IMP cyclohydrolase [Bacillus aquiflavi]